MTAGTLTAVAAAAVLAACGGGGTSAGGAAQGSGTDVRVTTVAGHKNVLTDANGGTLYVSDQERSGTVLCATNACTAIWAPLDVANGQHPTGPSSVSSHLGTVVRPDGKTQVTLDGAPLYTFTLDGGAGHTSGDGQHDSFGGTAFSWHTATTTGAATTSPSSTGGYGY